MEKIRILLDKVDDKLYKEGRDIYDARLIKDFSYTDTKIQAEIIIEKKQTLFVCVNLDKSGNLLSYCCECLTSFNSLCEHVVAILIAFVEKMDEGDIDKSRKRAYEIEDVVNFAEDREIKNFVINYAKTHNSFKRELVALFSSPDITDELEECKEKVIKALKYATYKGFIDYSENNRISQELNSVLETALRRAEQGHVVLSFLISLYVFSKLTKLLDESQINFANFSKQQQFAFEIVEKCALIFYDRDKLIEKSMFFDKVVKEAKMIMTGSTQVWHYRLLTLAARFATRENVNKIYNTLDYFKRKSKFTSETFDIEEKLVRLEIINNLYTSERAESFIHDNIEHDQFSELAFESAYKQRKFDFAEKICKDKIGEDNTSFSYFRAAPWHEKLYKIYVKTGDKKGQISQAEILLFVGKLEYFEELKNLLLEMGMWRIKCHEILERCKVELYPLQYMEILNKENEYNELLKQVIKYPDESLFLFGFELYLHFPAQMCLLFKSGINKQATEADTRKKCREVCLNIKKISEIGELDLAINLANDLLLKFNKYPTMTDEVLKIQKRIIK